MRSARWHHDNGSTLSTACLRPAPPPDLDVFAPTRCAALRRVLRVNPAAYARTRNHLDGAVTGLSPYFTHGFLTEAEVFAAWLTRFGVTLADSLGKELAWRCFFAHVRGWAGEGIFNDMRPGLAVDYAPELPADVLEARTGVPVIDASVRRLYATGYLHNHARLWLASYIVHLRKTHWRAGADWLYGHLLDGDPASNHLSWQWVAGTFSAKPYLFNADNVARYAPALASAGSCLDTDYLQLAERAATPVDAGPEPGLHAGIAPPPLFPTPPAHTNPPLPALSGCRVALMHPWALGWTVADPADFTLGVIVPSAHVARPWSARRWAFVREGLARRCDAVWVGEGTALATALAGAQCVARVPPESSYAMALAGTLVTWESPPAALPDTGLRAASFSAYLKALQKRAPELF